ncbi:MULTISPECIES: ATP-binding protein [Acidobacteriaceae]|uniref:ATP-binding protein n=1 Tax=Acidobacteriaceae TaxID=204434 RepID=UPI00131CB8FB|nr:MULTISPECIES: ATP-binding protein [Acidobacteriaceae]MDW5265462.1 ATP-binding protein [Edaphobacter sp.]
MSTAQINAAEHDPTSTGSWAEANQACLVMEFARLRRKMDATGPQGDHPFRGPSIDDSQDQYRTSLNPPPAIDQIAETFELSTFERHVLLLCAGIEMDSTLAAQCSEALGFGRNDRRGAISFSLALAVLDDPHWSALAPSSPLRRFHLIELEPGHGLTSAPLRIDERILHYLAGVNQLDSRLELLLQTRSYPDWIAEEHAALANEAPRTLDIHSADAPVLHLCGDDPRGQEDVAAVIARNLGRQLFILPIENIGGLSAASSRLGHSETLSADQSEPASQLVSLWARESAILPAVLLVQCSTATLSAAATQLIERLPAPLILASRDPLILERRLMRLAVNKPHPASQKQLWAKALGPAGASLNGHLDEIAEQFRLNAETVASVGAFVGIATDDSGKVDPDRLWSTCRSLSRPRLDDLAQRILPVAGWDDLILPEPQKQALHQLAAQARHRMTVYESWGFAGKGRRGLGISALFAGASGTGKTLAAEVLARELRLDLYRIDLSAVVSKYIGESEKNLRQVFDAAEEGGVLLLFDECDALFGKRSEARDSHDRYANIEVSYLLQRMENFQGLAVLTTNFKSAMDKAFQRRLRFTVDFPFPGVPEREAIWQRAFPQKTPTSGLNIKRLAQLNMTGGNIRNIALNAAFLAAEAGSPVQMEHLLLATRQEAIKTERPLSENETRGWA